ncbi:YtxH domain-containing protein [Alkalihalobacillus sp. CinArs1]|uniref:YtxH domain-containing protein n=1 Tax=Alkalihalobacillus sp. CinArs1 TaxID=2995314 RepID=UPI0022DD67AD|nr:YtxH domain-containing protein [Alkalihalobacillus sp. CinArs1]
MNETYQKKSENKLFKAVLIGGLAGALISLLDRGTRQSIKEGSKRTGEVLREVKNNPSYYSNKVRQTVEDAGDLMKEVQDDITTLSKKFSGLKESSVEALNIVKETQKDIKEIGSRVVEAGEELTKDHNREITH